MKNYGFSINCVSDRKKKPDITHNLWAKVIIFKLVYNKAVQTNLSRRHIGLTHCSNNCCYCFYNNNNNFKITSILIMISILFFIILGIMDCRLSLKATINLSSTSTHSQRQSSINTETLGLYLTSKTTLI